MNTKPCVVASQMELLPIAGATIERQNQEDAMSPGLMEMTGVSRHGMSTASGLNDYDYQTLNSISVDRSTLAQLHTVNKVPIPPEILEHFKHIKCNCKMGLFPEIGRAWLTIDAEIYIWTYENSMDVAYYDGLSQMIVSVGLVKPRAGVFIADIKYLLLLITQLEIIILGVTFENTTGDHGNVNDTNARTAIIEGNVTGSNHMNPCSSSTILQYSEMQLMNKPIFILSSDNVQMNVVQGTDDGRIFLGGQDGCLYEITYQAETSWFGKRCKKINHSHNFISSILPNIWNYFSEADPIVEMAIDNQRQLLYTLSEKSSIEAWKMDANNYMTRLAKVTQNEITRCATNIIRTVDPCVLKGIKSICILQQDQCSSLHMLAVTQGGVRLYFSTATLVKSKGNLFQTSVEGGGATPLTAGGGGGNTSLGGATTGASGKHGMVSGASGSLGTGGGGGMVVTSGEQSGLFLLHVRLPPGYTPNTTVNKPKNVHLAHFVDNTLLMVSTIQQDQDLLWAISSASFLNNAHLTESTSITALDGFVWCMAEIPNPNIGNLQYVLRKTQHSKKLILLTNHGAHIVAIVQPINILQQLLTLNQGPHHESVKNFFKGEKEACVTALLLICSEHHRGSDVGMWAAQAFMLYGGEPTTAADHHHQQQQQVLMKGPGCGGGGKLHHLQQSAAGAGNMNTTNLEGCGRPSMSSPIYMSTPMTHATHTAANSAIRTPTQPQPPSHGHHQTQHHSMLNSGGGNLTGHEGHPTSNNLANNNKDNNITIFSARHNALYLYVARLMRPIWKLRCLKSNFISNLSGKDCSYILEDLITIKQFLEMNSLVDVSQNARSSHNNGRNTTMFSNGYVSSPGPATLQTTNTQINIPERAFAEEKHSLTALHYFIKNSFEILSLWKILCEHDFPTLIQQLPLEQQNTLSTCTFRDLILTHIDVGSQLMVILMNSYLNDNASVNSISMRLRDVCPNLYSHEDAVCFKATEILMNANRCTNREERQSQLRTALQICKDTAPHLPLHNICQQFTLGGFYEGVLELTSVCATKIDAEEFAIHYYKNEEPEEDREGFAAYAARMNCYKEVQIMLDHVYQTFSNNLKGGKMITANESNVIRDSEDSIANVSDQIMRIVALGIQYKDPILHVSIFEWLLMRDMLSELLKLSQDTLGEFLRRNALRHPHNIKLIDLLWKYYEKNGHHAQAAQILDNLASMQYNSIDLDQRIEYLARSVMCMRNECVGYSVSNGVLLKDLEDKLEIARIQKMILNALSAPTLPCDDQHLQKAISELNNCLYDITQLYEHFADAFDLWECKLKILNCSHHNDPLLIESIWGQIINKCLAETQIDEESSVRLFTKMETLIKEFSESGHCFPLAYIIRELELKACQYRFPMGIVPQKLYHMHLDTELLMEYYSRMLSINERIWANEGNEWHLVESSITLLTLLVNNANALWARSRRRVIGKAQDMVSVCLNLCYQKPNTDRLQMDLKEVQCRLTRCLS